MNKLRLPRQASYLLKPSYALVISKLSRSTRLWSVCRRNPAPASRPCRTQQPDLRQHWVEPALCVSLVSAFVNASYSDFARIAVSARSNSSRASAGFGPVPRARPCGEELHASRVALIELVTLFGVIGHEPLLGCHEVPVHHRGAVQVGRVPSLRMSAAGVNAFFRRHG